MNITIITIRIARVKYSCVVPGHLNPMDIENVTRALKVAEVHITKTSLTDFNKLIYGGATWEPVA